MVKYDGTHLLIDLDCKDMDRPKLVRNVLMKSLLFITSHIDPEYNTGGLDEVCDVCQLIESMVDEADS